MITLKRVRTAPPVHANFYGKKRVALNLKLLQLKREGILDDSSESDKWDSSIWKMAKDQLLLETHGKCAYCETPTSVVDYGDVEHFRPKSKYWWLAYSYENYLASCALCNQKFKSDKFSLRGGYSQLKGLKITKSMTDKRLEKLAVTLTVDPIDDSEGYPILTFENDLSSEWALLVNPYSENPADYFAYKPILINKEVHIIPTSKKYKDVVNAAHEDFGINRQELLDLRFQWYCLYMTHRHTLNDPGINANTKLMNQTRLDELSESYAPYAGMVRYLNQQKLEDLPWDFKITSRPDLIYKPTN